MPRNLNDPAERRKELRDISFLRLKRALKDVKEELEFLILDTPSSDLRNSLTDTNIHCMSAQDILDRIKINED